MFNFSACRRILHDFVRSPSLKTRFSPRKTSKTNQAHEDFRGPVGGARRGLALGWMGKYCWPERRWSGQSSWRRLKRSPFSFKPFGIIGPSAGAKRQTIGLKTAAAVVAHYQFVCSPFHPSSSLSEFRVNMARKILNPCQPPLC